MATDGPTGETSESGDINGAGGENDEGDGGDGGTGNNDGGNGGNSGNANGNVNGDGSASGNVGNNDDGNNGDNGGSDETDICLELDCDDGNACTTDSCDPSSGCINTVVDICDIYGGEIPDTDDGIDEGEGSDGDGDGDGGENDDNEDGFSELDKIQYASVQIWSYNLEVKKMVSGTYDAYSFPDSIIRVICQQPCSIPEIVLKKKLLGAEEAVADLLVLTGADVLAKYIPVDIHLTSSAECGDYASLYAKYGYVSKYYSPRPGPASDGIYMCLWEADDDNIVLPLTEENAQKIEAQKLLIHEYSHMIFHGRTKLMPQTFEDFVKAFSFYVSGYWDGSGTTPEDFPKITDACSPTLEEFGADVYNLCTKCGFNFDDIVTLFDEIDAAGIPVTKQTLKGIFDSITGKDSVTDCGIDWLN